MTEKEGRNYDSSAKYPVKINQKVTNQNAFPHSYSILLYICTSIHSWHPMLIFKFEQHFVPHEVYELRMIEMLLEMIGQQN